MDAAVLPRVLLLGSCDHAAESLFKSIENFIHYFRSNQLDEHQMALLTVSSPCADYSNAYIAGRSFMQGRHWSLVHGTSAGRRGSGVHAARKARRCTAVELGKCENQPVRVDAAGAEPDHALGRSHSSQHRVSQLRSIVSTSPEQQRTHACRR